MIPDDVAADTLTYGLQHMVTAVDERLNDEDEWSNTAVLLVYRGRVDPDDLDLDDLPDGSEALGAVGFGLAHAELGPCPYLPTTEAMGWYADDLRIGGQHAWLVDVAEQIPPGAIVMAVITVYQASAILPPTDLDGLTPEQAQASVRNAPTLTDHPWVHDVRYVAAVDIHGQVIATQRVRGDEPTGATGSIAEIEKVLPGLHAQAEFLDATLDRLMALETL